MIFLKVQADNIMLKERKLNIAPAIKKQVKSTKRYCIVTKVDRK